MTVRLYCTYSPREMKSKMHSNAQLMPSERVNLGPINNTVT